jgi:hypothetical protein
VGDGGSQERVPGEGQGVYGYFILFSIFEGFQV